MGDAKTPVAILVRVSTVKQETTRQVSELKSYAEAKHYAVVEVCEETISGTAENGQRHGLRRVEELAELAKSRKCWFMRFRVWLEGTASLINSSRLWRIAACRYIGMRGIVLNEGLSPLPFGRLWYREPEAMRLC